MEEKQNYIISIINTKHKRMFFGYDKFDIYHATGMPCWTKNIAQAEYFDTLESAKECFEKTKKYLKTKTNVDITTLSVGHINIVEDEKLSFN